MLRDGHATKPSTKRQFGKIRSASLFVLMAMIWLRVSIRNKIFLNIFQISIVGKKRDFHRCKRTGLWQKPELVDLSCVADGELIWPIGENECFILFRNQKPFILIWWTSKIRFWHTQFLLKIYHQLSMIQEPKSDLGPFLNCLIFWYWSIYEEKRFEVRIWTKIGDWMGQNWIFEVSPPSKNVHLQTLFWAKKFLRVYW